MGYRAVWTDGSVEKHHCGEDFMCIRSLVDRVFQSRRVFDLLLTHHGCYALVAKLHLAQFLLLPVVDICESYLTAHSCASTCYMLDVDSLRAGEWNRHKNALTWVPSQGYRRAREPSVAVPLWSDHRGTWSSLPTAYAWRHFGPPARDLRWTSSPIPLERAVIMGDTTIAPHAPEFLATAAAIEDEIAKRQYGGTLQMPPGYGKTRLLLHCISMSRARSIILAHSRVAAEILELDMRKTCPLLRVASIRTSGHHARESRQIIAVESDVLIVLGHIVDRVSAKVATSFERVYVYEYELIPPATLADWFRRWAPRAWIGLGTGQARDGGGHKVADLLFGESPFRMSPPTQTPGHSHSDVRLHNAA